MFLEPSYKTEVFHLLNSELKIDSILLENLYAYFLKSSENEDFDLKEKYKSIRIEDLNEELHKDAIGKCSYGIDLPVWFGSKGQNRKKIFLLAMDPMRGADDRTTADLNSPFSIHLGNNNNYISSIKHLSDSFDIYITDVFKLFYRDPINKKKVSNASLNFTQLEIHSRIIIKEIDLFNPDLILCLGKHPLAGLRKIKGLTPEPKSTIGPIYQYSFNSIPTFAIPHASGVASRWAQTFLKNNNWEKPYNSKSYISDAMDIILKKLNSNL